MFLRADSSEGLPDREADSFGAASKAEESSLRKVGASSRGRNIEGVVVSELLGIGDVAVRLVLFERSLEVDEMNDCA